MAAPDPLAPLLAAALEGDDRALGELVRRTQGSVWRVCRALGSADDVEDLVQETYLRATRSMTNFRGEAPVSAWLLTIARRVCADDVRRRQRRRRLDDRLRRTTVVETVAPCGDALRELVDRLDEDRRDAFVLTQIAGMSYEEAAEALGCPIGTVRSRVARARGELAELVRLADAR